MSFDDEIVADFLMESDENLETLDKCLMAIEQGEAPNVDAIFRAMHSIKSAAGFLEIVALEKIAHSAETSLSFVRDSGRTLHKKDVDVLIQSTGYARQILDAFKEGKNTPVEDISEIMVQLKAMEQRMESGEESAENDVDVDTGEDTSVDDVEHISEDSDVAVVDTDKKETTETKVENPVVTASKLQTPTPVTPEASSVPTGPKIASRPVRGLSSPQPLQDPRPKEDAPISAPVAPVEKTLSVPSPKTPAIHSVAQTSTPVAKKVEQSTNTEAPKVDTPPQIKSRPVRGSKSGADTVDMHDDEHGDGDSKKSDSKVTVSIELLDEIINMVGELVVARNQIIRYVEEKGLDAIKPMVLPIAHLTTDIQEKVMKTRMRQIGSAWSRYPRMIRDLGKELSKQIDLKMIGQETELDRSLLTMLQEPMRHLLRNAVDHGLETPEERKAMGKSPEGTVWLKAYQASGQVVIEISDDGRGLHPDKILQKAIRSGIVSPQKAEKMNVEDIQKLIFAPGFSTKETVTNISGRGVGMDVVHTMITKVGGLVEIDSTVDEGSTFRIRLPLTLAILPALIVLSRDNYFAVPQDNLLEIIDIRDGLSNLRQIGGAMVYYLRGQLLPLVSLSLLTENKKTDSQANINSGYILVVQVNSVTYGLIVENLLDTEEIVVKPLGKELKGLDIFSGVTIHGNGKIAWIVDAASVAVKSQIEEQIATLDAQSSEEEENFEDIVSILRFEVPTVGSIGVDILSVLRVEQIRRSDLKTHGSRFVFSFNKEVIPVFTFGLKTLEFTTAFLIILDITEEGNSHKIALFAQEIHDVCKQAIQVTKALKEPWSVGITLLDDIPTAIIDSEEIFGCVV